MHWRQYLQHGNPSSQSNAIATAVTALTIATRTRHSEKKIGLLFKTKQSKAQIDQTDRAKTLAHTHQRDHNSI